MNCPLFYRYGVLLLALGAIEAVTVRHYDVSSANINGVRYGAGFFVFLPGPLHLVYIAYNSSYLRTIEGAMEQAEGDMSMLPAIGNLIDSYRDEPGSGISPNYDIASFVFFETSGGTLTFRYSDGTLNVLELDDADELAEVSNKLRRSGAHHQV